MSAPYSLLIIGREPNRFLPAVLAVAFSALLITGQCGLLIGTLSVLSLPIDRTGADLWVTAPDVLSLELGQPIPESWRARVEGLPGVECTEAYLSSFGYWHKPHGGSVVCCIIGSRLDAGALGALGDLTPDARTRLTEPGAVIVDESELDRLGLAKGVGAVADVSGHRVRVVGLMHGFKSVGAPFVFCSLRTARLILPLFHGKPGDTMYILARCRRPDEVAAVLARLRQDAHWSAFTRAEFSRRTRTYWLTRTKAGIGMGFTAALALLVGLVVTSQTLYAATVASLREYAVLRALGITRLRMARMVLEQSFWVGAGGIVLALPAVFGLAAAGDAVGAKILLPPWLLGTGAALTMSMALFSGLAALRSLRLVEPITLLR
jgi:putative ABC transport system permease protein